MTKDLAEPDELRDAARAIFGDALAAADARRAVLGAVEVVRGRLRVCDAEFDLSAGARKIYSVALGKAAAAMASALDERLEGRLSAGVLSGRAGVALLSPRWRVFEGGHPLPNEASVEAARAAFELLREADGPESLVVFMVSGGGSAMIESPRDTRVTLADLREANRVLVSCGAAIAEVNAVRRALSAVKGGGLSARAPRAPQVTLIVSDVGEGRDSDVASGPTLPLPSDSPAAEDVIARYGLAQRLPAPVVRALAETAATGEDNTPPAALRRHFVLLDNSSACEAAAESARARGFAVGFARDLVEQRVAEGAAALVSRLLRLYRREGGRGVCLVSGGEFACPVRGGGTGGRNSETALRVAFEIEKVFGELAGAEACRVAALSAGTDGVDGNSPAAGALADHTTLRRARESGMNPEGFLEGSDAYTFFSRLGDAVVTGPTGTNVRDVRILLAG